MDIAYLSSMIDVRGMRADAVAYIVKGDFEWGGPLETLSALGL